MPGGIEVVDQLEARLPARPVDGGDVEKQVESEIRLQLPHDVGEAGGRERQHEHSVPFGNCNGGRGKVLGHATKNRRGHRQNVPVRMGCDWREILSCSCMMPSITVSGRGGQPGT